MKRQHQAARSRASPDVRLPIMIELITPFINFKSLVYEEFALPGPGDVWAVCLTAGQPREKLSYEKIITVFCCFAGWGRIELPLFLDTPSMGIVCFLKIKHLIHFLFING